MTLEELVKEGEDLEQYVQDGLFGKNLSGKQYSEWIPRCLRFMETNYPESILTKRFCKESEDAVGKSAIIYYNLLGYIKALQL